MTADAILDVTRAFRVRLEQAVGAGQVYVGPPVVDNVGERRLALFLFHLVPNRELRNDDQLLPESNDPDGPLVPTPALALDLHFMISVFRVGGDGAAEPNELSTLGLAMQAIQAEPSLGGSLLDGPEARITPEPYPMEEVSRVWSLFPETSYRTSVVYMVSPVFITTPTSAGPRVEERTYRSGPFLRSFEPPTPAERKASRP